MDYCYWVSSRSFACFLIIYFYFIFSSSSLRSLDYLHFFKILSVSLNSLIIGSFTKNCYYWVTSWSYIFYLTALVAFLHFSSSSSGISNYLHFWSFIFSLVTFIAFLPLSSSSLIILNYLHFYFFLSSSVLFIGYLSIVFDLYPFFSWTFIYFLITLVAF